MNQQISEFGGESLYLDTMIFYLLLRETGSTAEPLFRRIQAGEFQAYTSALTFDELTYRLLLARFVTTILETHLITYAKMRKHSSRNFFQKLNQY